MGYSRKNGADKHSGICVVITFMHRNGNLTFKKNLILSEYLRNNLPKGKYDLWINQESGGGYLTTKGDCFCWKPFSLKPRLNWINKQIKKLES